VVSQAEASISSEKTKFFHVFSQLDHRYPTEVEDIITSPPDEDLYTTLRTEFLGWLSPPPPPELGNRKPSQFLRHLKSLEDLSRQVAALSPEQSRLRTSSRIPLISSRNPYSTARELLPGYRNRRPGCRFY
jgi:hypothetical protein